MSVVKLLKLKRDRTNKKRNILEFGIVNDLDEDLRIFWYNFNIPIFYDRINSGANFSTYSFQHQNWLLTGADKYSFNKSFTVGEGLFAQNHAVTKASEIINYTEEIQVAISSSNFSINLIYFCQIYNSNYFLEKVTKNSRIFEFCIENNMNSDLNIFWYNYEIPVFYQTIEAASNFTAFSLVNQRWLLTGNDKMKNTFKLGFGLFKHKVSNVKATDLFSYNTGALESNTFKSTVNMFGKNLY